MTFNAAGKRTWSPKGRPKSHARNNGYSLAEGGVATSYPAFGAFMGRVIATLRVSLLFAACLIVSQVSVAQITAPGTVVTCRTTAEDACDSLATGRAGVALSLTATSPTSTASTVVTAAPASSSRRRASARLRAAR